MRHKLGNWLTEGLWQLMATGEKVDYTSPEGWWWILVILSSNGFHFQVKLELGHQMRMRMETELEVNHHAPFKALLMMLI